MGVGLAMNRIEKEIPPSFKGVNETDLSIAVGVVKEMLRYDYKQRISLNKAQLVIGEAFISLIELQQLSEK